MSVDDTDLEVLKALFDLEDPSPGAIAEETGIPTSTVHYRLDGLKQEGIIKNELYEIDANALGLGVQLISEVNAEYEEGYHARVGERLRSIEGVTQVYFTMGDTDFIVISNLPSSAHVERLMQAFQSTNGVIRTSSTLVISSIKSDSNPLDSYELDTLKELELYPTNGP